MGLKGYAKVQISVLEWGGKFFVDTDFDITTGGDIDKYQAVTREGMRSAWSQMALSANRPVGANTLTLAGRSDLHFAPEAEAQAAAIAQGVRLTAPMLPQDVWVDVDVPYATEVRVILDSQGDVNMDLIDPDSNSYGPDNLPSGINYTALGTFIPGPGFSPSAQLGMGQIRATHAVQGGSPVDVWIDGSPIFTNLAYTQTSSYSNYAPGQHEITFVAAGSADTSAPLAQETVIVAEGSAATVIAIGNDQNIQSWVLADDTTPRGENGMTTLRMVNASNTTLTLQERMGGELFVGIPGPGNSEYANVVAKRTSLNLLDSATETIVIEMGKHELASGALYTVFVFNDGDGVQATLVQDALPVAQLAVSYVLGSQSPLVLVVDGRTISDTFTVNHTAGPLYLAAGEHTVQLLNGSSEIFSQAITLTGDGVTGLALFEDSGTVTSKLLTNDHTPEAGRGSMRLVHQSSLASTVNVALLNPATGVELPLLAGVAPEQVSDSQDVEGSAYGYTVIVRDAATDAVLIKLQNVPLKSGTVGTLYLTDMAGQITLGYGMDAQLVAKTLAVYQITEAAVGQWQVHLSGDLFGDNYELTVEADIPAPSLSNVRVDNNGAFPVLSWNLSTPEPGAAVNVYFQEEPLSKTVTVTDTNGVPQEVVQDNFVGAMITGTLNAPVNPTWTEGSSESYYTPAWTDGSGQTFTLPTEHLFSGTYYIYMEVDDGATDLLRVGAPEPIVVTHPWPETWTANLSATATNYREVTLEWDELTNPETTSYAVLYETTGFTQTFSAGTFDSSGVRLPNLNPNQTYTFTVRAQHRDDVQTVESEFKVIHVDGADYSLALAGDPLQMVAGQSVAGNLVLSTAFDPHPVSVSFFAGARSSNVGLELSTESVLPTQASVSIPFTLSVGANQPAGTYTATVLAIGGGVEKNLELSVQVNAPSFELQATQAQATLTEDGYVTLEISANRLLGHDLPIFLETVDSPSMRNDFSVESIGVGETAVLTITDMSFIHAGVYTYTIRGTDGLNSFDLERTLEVAKTSFQVSVPSTQITVTGGVTTELNIPLSVDLLYGWPSSVVLLLDFQNAPTRGLLGFVVPVPGRGVMAEEVELIDNLTFGQSGEGTLYLNVDPNTPEGLYRLPIQSISNGQQQETEIWLSVVNPPDLMVTANVAIGEAAPTNEIDIVPGDRLTFTLDVVNLGGTTATDVTLTDAFPAQIKELAVDSQGITITQTTSDPAYVWQLADMEPGDSGTITVTGVVDPALLSPTPFTNTVSIATTGSDGDDTNNEADIAFTVSFVPVTTDDTYRTYPGIPLTVTVDAGVLANDQDPIDTPLSAKLVTAPDGGELALAIDGSFVYTPAVGFNNGYVTFDYTADNGSRATPARATIRIADDLPGIALDAGWNLFGYPLVESRPVITALQSITGSYDLVLAWEKTDTASPWHSFKPSWPAQLNKLQALTFGQGYWIKATEAVTIELGPASLTLQQEAEAAGLPMPPATYYGLVYPQDDLVIAAEGLAVQAWVGDTLCGQGQAVQLTQGNEEFAQGSLVFAVHVMAEASDTPGCGTPGRMVRLTAADLALEVTVPWDQDVVQRVDLRPTVDLPFHHYLPLVSQALSQ
jgi:uncharacterized repeat protein (TIGR01451 family)